MDSPAGAGPSFDRLSRKLDDELASVELQSVSGCQAACRLLLSTRGKLLRGRLVMASAQLGPNPDATEVLDAAFAVELLHLASLAHDDIVDAGTVRRGSPTATAKFGRRASGLAGARIFARAVEVMASCGQAAIEQLGLTAQELCQGGMAEVRDLRYLQRSSEEYALASRKKTASLFVSAATLGAELAGASQSTIEEVGSFGFEFGMAWQIWDDLEDLLVDWSVTGKRAGDDLQRGVYTLPVIFALEECPELRATLASDRRPADWYAAVKRQILGTGAVTRARQIAEQHADRAGGLVEADERWMPLTDLLRTARNQHESKLEPFSP